MIAAGTVSTITAVSDGAASGPGLPVTIGETSQESGALGG